MVLMCFRVTCPRDVTRLPTLIAMHVCFEQPRDVTRLPTLMNMHT